MPVVAPTPADALPTPAPQTNDPTNFSTRADLLLAALPNNTTQINALAANAYANAQYVEAQATAGLASSNFKGSWSTLTGALNMPASVYHAGVYWQLLANLANVTTATPGVSASWVELPAWNSRLSNRLINGAMAIDQRNAGAAQTFTAGAALAYCVDRWYGYCTGANVTGQRVAGAGTSQYRYRFTGAASVTGIGFAQRIEAANCYDLNNGTATIGIDLANSLLTTVTWAAYYATTTDAFGTLAAPTRTLIATGTWTVNATVDRYYAGITVPAAATTGIELVLSVGAQTSGTWTIGKAQLSPGVAQEPYIEQRSYGQELVLCQRYLPYVEAGAANQTVAVGQAFSTTQAYINVKFPVTARVAPTGLVAAAAANWYVSDAAYVAKTVTVIAHQYASKECALVAINVASGLVAGNATVMAGNNQAAMYWTGAEL